jgi:hypothetical protein
MGTKTAGLVQLLVGGAAFLLWAYKVFVWNSDFNKSMESAAAFGLDISFWGMVGIGLWVVGVGAAVIALSGFFIMKSTVPFTDI